MLCLIADIKTSIPTTGGMSSRCANYIINGNDSEADIIINDEFYRYDYWHKLGLNDDDASYMDSGSGIEESPSNLDIKEEQQQQSSSNDNNTSLPDKPNEDDPTDSQQLQDIVLDISSLKFTAEEYIKYCSLSEDEQYDFYKSFNSSDDFFSWYNKAKKEYDKLNPITVINPGDAIDLSGD